jgi:hypothetical protein
VRVSPRALRNAREKAASACKLSHRDESAVIPFTPFEAKGKGVRMAQHHRIPVSVSSICVIGSTQTQNVLTSRYEGVEGQRLKRTTEFGGDLDSTLVTNPEVHVVMAANHVNPKL